MSTQSLLERAAFVAAATLLSAANIRAQGAPCSASITADVSSISVSAGGTQTITVTTNVPQYLFSMVGSFSGTTPAEPYFAYGGLFLARDRYLLQSYAGNSRLIQGGFPNAPGGHQFFTDLQGSGVQHVVVPPGASSILVGRTVRHGVYTLSNFDLLPTCGSNTVALTFAP